MINTLELAIKLQDIKYRHDLGNLITSKKIEDKIELFFEIKKVELISYKIDIKENWYLLLILINTCKEDRFDINIADLLVNFIDSIFDKKLNIKNFFDLLKDTLIKKNSDYGNSFEYLIKKYGWQYLAIELDKKKRRLHNLLKNKDKPNFESIDNNLLDIAGYLVLSMCVYEINKGQ